MDELHARGCKVAGVVVDPPATNADLVRQAGLAYPILSDPDLRTIDAYGLRHEHGGPDGAAIARSASVLVDAGGVVRWTFVTTNIRVRPTADDVIAAVDAVCATPGRCGAPRGRL
jgi:peroxiredoxin